MSTLAHPLDATAAHGHGHGHGRMSFLTRYIFSRDHKIIGIQFLFSTLIFFAIGGLLAMAIRWQLAWPWSNMPIIGKMLFARHGYQISPEFYTALFTMHGTIMIFFVIIPILAGAFGNFLIPLQIGAEDMAFPTLNMLSYWFMWPAFILILASFFAAGGAPAAGWTSYPTLTSVPWAAPGSYHAQTFWLAAIGFVGVSSMMGSVNYITTILTMRAPGMTMFRLPLTTWAMLITAILQAFALPVLTAAVAMQLLDRVAHTNFFMPHGLIVNNVPAGVGGGQTLLWQHLFWFYSHPAVYIMILPAMGMVSDLISAFARKPVFGYRPMVYSLAGIAGLGFIVWGHHMFQSGMNPYLGMSFMISTMLIALPSAIKVFNWIGTLYGGNIQFTTPMLNAMAFVSMFIIGGLSGVFMAATPVDIQIHDTYFIVAHIHYVLFGASVFGIFGGIHYWFPKMFGRMMNETLGKIHFALTFITYNCTFLVMHLVGIRGMDRRLADPYDYPTFHNLLGMNKFISMSAFALGLVQIIWIVNFVYSLFYGPRAGNNPWKTNTLEWTTPSPPPHGNFTHTPIVYRPPYEYGSPEVPEDYLPQDRKLEPESPGGPKLS